MICYLCLACGKSELWEEHSLLVQSDTKWKPVSGRRSVMRPDEFLSALNVSDARVEQILGMASSDSACDEWSHVTFECRFPVQPYGSFDEKPALSS